MSNGDLKYIVINNITKFQELGCNLEKNTERSKKLDFGKIIKNDWSKKFNFLCIKNPTEWNEKYL